jgi:hypothetical protein
MSLKYYTREEEAYKEAYSLKVSDEQAITIVKKLCHHFMKPHGMCGSRLRKPTVIFYGHRQSGMAYHNGNIRLSHNPSLGLVCHEVGHQVVKYNRKPNDPEVHHTKKLLHTVGKLINYAMKNGLWIYIIPAIVTN